MPNYGTFARFADYRPPTQSVDFVRMPDGSLIMTGQRATQPPSILDRLKAAVSSFIPAGRIKATEEPAIPWWIQQQQTAPMPLPTPPISNPSPLASGLNRDWEDIKKESQREQAIAEQLGDFSRRVMASPQLIEGKWFK